MEFALAAPALFLLIFGTIEFGRLLWTQEALNYSVQEGARCWMVQPDGTSCTTAAAVQAFAANATPQLGFPSSTFTATSNATCGSHKVTASYTFKFVATGLMPVSPTLTAQACFP